jgi:hypothetical protein
MRRDFRRVLGVFVLAAACIGCAKPPVEDMDNATAAVARAENDPDVVMYAQSALGRARETLNTMRSEAEAKRYDEARRLAADVAALAEKAILDGRGAAVRARDEAANAIAVMESAITEADQEIENARVARKGDTNFEEVDRDFTDAKALADRARNANGEKRYREAIDGSSQVRSQLSAITSRIGQAAIAVSRKK